MTYFLNSYKPLCYFKQGQEAISAYSLPPFIDYSIRKEPDFLSPYPAITALCRGGQFAPRLHPGDSVVYITVKGRYLGLSINHWRLTAILDVLYRFDTHEAAVEWYQAQGVALPNNCMVDGNPFTAIEQTAPVTEFGTDARRWDVAYRSRVRANGVLLVCKASYLELHDPVVITEDDMRAIFGRIPVTQNPPRISADEFMALRALVGQPT